MKIVKKVLALMFAGVMMVSSIAVALPRALVVAEAADSYTLDITTENTGYTVEETTAIDETVFVMGSETEKDFVFTVESDATTGELSLELGSDTVADVLFDITTPTASTAVFAGITVTKSTAWVAGDTFTLTVTKTSGTVTTPVTGTGEIVISDRYIYREGRTQEISSIDKNDRVDIKLTAKVFDTPGMVDAMTTQVFMDGGSFKMVNSTTSPSTARAVYGGTVNGVSTFTITFDSVQFTGEGESVDFVLLFEDGGKEYSFDVSQPFTEYYLEQYVPRVDDDDDDDDDEEIEFAPITPHIIVDEYSFGGEAVTAGTDVTLKLSLKNTSIGYPLDNIIMKVDLPDGITLANGSNSYHLDRLAKGGTFEQTLNLKVLASALPKSHEISIDFSFQYMANDTRLDGSSQETIAIPVVQVDRFSINSAEAPEEIYQDDNDYLTVALINKGQSPVYNVSAVLIGDIGGAGSSEFLGNVESGAEENVEFRITGTTPGIQQCTVEITYEDSNLNIKKLTYPISINVIEYEEYDPWTDPYYPGGDGMIPEEPVEPTGGIDLSEGSSMRNILTICGSIIALITAYTTIMKIKVQRSEFADEDI